MLGNQRLEAILDGLSQWGPLTSGPEEKRKEKKRKGKEKKTIRAPPGLKANAPLSVCSASSGPGSLVTILAMGTNQR